MIGNITGPEIFIKSITQAVRKQSIWLLQFLNDIINSPESRRQRYVQNMYRRPSYDAASSSDDTDIVPYHPYTTEQKGFLPQGLSEEAWLASLTASFYVSLFAVSSLYLYVKNKARITRQPELQNILDIGRLKNMPSHIQDKVNNFRALSDLNTQLSIYHMLVGADYSGDAERMDKELDKLISKVNEELIDFFDAHPMPYNELFINKAFQRFEDEPERMISGNGTFIQLIARANKSPDEAIRTRAHRLYERYLSDSNIACYTNVPDFGHPETRAVDWNDAHANNYILLPSSDFKIGMLISQDTLDKMIGADPVKPDKTLFHLYTPAGVELEFESYPLNKFFEKHYPLFMECTEQVLREENCAELLNKIIPNDQTIRDLFLSARQSQFSQQKLTGAENSASLRRIFYPWLRASQDNDRFILDEKHCRTLLETAGLADESVTEQAKMLLNLAIFFIKSAGENIFGTETESPVEIRLYAWALMIKAYSLDRNIFKSGIQSWMSILFSADELPQKSDTLARILIEHMKLDFPEALAEIMPPAWYQ